MGDWLNPLAENTPTRWCRTLAARRTSAAPQREDSARLPCLATGTSAPATMNAAQVEVFYKPVSACSLPCPPLDPLARRLAAWSVLIGMVALMPRRRRYCRLAVEVVG